MQVAIEGNIEYNKKDFYKSAYTFTLQVLTKEKKSLR